MAEYDYRPFRLLMLILTIIGILSVAVLLYFIVWPVV
jgi:hypothetical protein